jgi:hypothetical protein
MRFSFCHRRSRALRHRLVAAIALAAYLVTTVGLPLPAYVTKQSGVPFPCQHHACGCATAKQCWEHCCCYSAAEKLAWAREHHVEPPAHLVAEVAAIEADPVLSAAKCQAACSHSCCAEHKAHASCCDEHDAPSAGLTFVLGIKARVCRGLVDFWCLSGAVLPPPSVVGWQFQWDVVEWLALDASSLHRGHPAPAVPPPRA